MAGRAGEIDDTRRGGGGVGGWREGGRASGLAGGNVLSLEPIIHNFRC